MRYPIIGRRAIASLLLLTYLLGSTGCSSWQTQAGSAQAILAARPEPQRPDTSVTTGPDGSRSMAINDQDSRRIRVATTTQPKMTVVTGPRIVNDSLYGLFAGSRGETGIALDQVTGLQVRKASPGRTVALVGGIVVVVGAGAATVGTMIALSSECWFAC